MTEYQSSVLLDGLLFSEAPRWHAGRLWFSDMWRGRVIAMDPDGKVETVVDVPRRPSGLGWRPDGTLLVVSMEDHRLMQLASGGLEEVADLSELATGDLNDMVVDAQGRAYIGNFGFELLGGEMKSAVLAMVTPDNEIRVVATDLLFPNGTVITPDGRTLIIAETFARRLTAFDIGSDGELSGRRVFADLGERIPDGICLDAQRAIWFANPLARECVRVTEGGEVTDRVMTQHPTFACMLGGDDGRILFICSGEGSEEDRRAGNAEAFIEMARAEVPHAGLP